jgi:hypothetical protein
MTDLCETFRYQSGRVWNRVAKAPTVGMSLSDETLTETALCACPGYRKDHIKALACAVPTRFGTCNGKRSPQPALRTDGNGRLAVASGAFASRRAAARKPGN